MPGYPCPTVYWPAVVRVGELKVSPLCPASGCSARRRLPSRGSLGPHCPTFLGTMRRDDCHLPVSGSCTCRSFPDTLPASIVRGLPYGLVAGRKLPVTPGPLVTRSPNPGIRQGDRRLSQVPKFPLCRHAPLSDPGGVLRTRQHAPRTAAFQPRATVGFPPRYPFRGSITRPVSSLHPASYGPLRGGTRVRY
jgi:hypothetical protein